MGNLKVKVCGMRNPENIRAVAELRPDYLGFIFYAKSPRYVGDHFSVLVPAGVEPVGVFVNEDTERILDRLASIRSHVAQLHGSESPAQCAELKSRNVTVVKVFSIDDQFDFRITSEYAAVADLFLFDTKGKWHGGNAMVFNWRKLEEYDQSKPFFLSGGLTPDNLEGIRALSDMNIYGLDINSGVESAPGMKDVDKVRRVLGFRQATGAR